MLDRGPESMFDVCGDTVVSNNACDAVGPKVCNFIYTWQDCFVKTMREVKPTDLIEHSIDLTSGAKPVYASIKRYTAKEKQFAARISPEMEVAAIIMRAASDWGARTQFPPKKKGSDALRVVHNFISVNKYTIKSQYLMYGIDEVTDTIIKLGYRAFFRIDVSNGYWAILVMLSDKYKTGFATLWSVYLSTDGPRVKGSLCHLFAVW